MTYDSVILTNVLLAIIAFTNIIILAMIYKKSRND